MMMMMMMMMMMTDDSYITVFANKTTINVNCLM